MQPREAAELLTLMRGTWSRLATDEVANQLWLDDLVKLEQRPAIEAFRSLRGTQDRAPSWALFREAYGAQARRFAPREIAGGTVELPPPSDVERERVHALVGGLKGRLTDEPRVRNRHVGIRPSMPEPQSGFDPLERPLSYDEAYAEDERPAGTTDQEQQR